MGIGRISRGALTLLVALGLFASPGDLTETARAAGPVAQDVPEPPALVATYFRSQLTGTDIFQAGACPTGRGGGGNVNDGFLLYVQGRCLDTHTGAFIAVRAQDVAVGDGEVSVEFKVISGAERAILNLYVRIQGGSYDAAFLNLSNGLAELFKRDSSGVSIAGSRQGIGELDPTNWNRLGLRFVGDQVWLLVNDVPLIYSAGLLDQNGGIGLQIEREGSPDDGEEVAIVFRDLALSGFVPAPDEEPAP